MKKNILKKIKQDTKEMKSKFVDLEKISKEYEDFVLTDKIIKEYDIKNGDIVYVYESSLSLDNGFRIVRKKSDEKLYLLREYFVRFDPYDDIEIDERLKEFKEYGYKNNYDQAFKDAMSKANEWL